MTSKAPLRIDTVTLLKAAPVGTDAMYFVAGAASVGDGKGGFYRWDPASVAVEDTKYLAVVKSTASASGRWVRVISWTFDLPQGTLAMSAGRREFTASGVTDANGDCGVYLTLDNTAGGTPIFTEITFGIASATMIAAGATNDIIVGSKKAESTTTRRVWRFGKGKTTVLGVLTSLVGLNITPLAAPPAGTPVEILVVGR